MDSLLFAILVIINQVSLAGGAVTITFDDNGYIGHSIVLQCKTDATSVVAQSAIWYFNGNVISSNSTGGFSETKTPDGFNLTISSLTVNHAGYYRCRIDFGSSLNKTLGILYNTQSKDISIQKGQSAGTITITITAYPDPTYTVSVTEVQNGLATPVTNVNWTSVKTTQPNDVIIRTLTANNFTKDTYNITVTVTSTWPVPIIVHEMVIFAITTTITGTTTTTTITVTSSSLSSTSMSSTTSSATTDNTSTKPTTNGPSVSATSSTFISPSPITELPRNDTNNTSTSRSPTITGSAVSATSNTSASTSSTAVSSANNTSNVSTSANPTTAEPTTTTKTSAENNGTKSNISDTDIKVIVPAVVVPCGLLIIGALVLVVFCVRHKARKNVQESRDGMAIQDKSNNIDGWKQSLGHGKATDNIDTVYTTPDGFIIYPGPAAISTARSYKDNKYHGVTDQYSRPNPGTHHHQADYIPSTYTSARAYTHRDKKHHVVTDQYSRPYPDTYGYQSAYFPSTYKSARTYAQKGKTYEGHHPVYNPTANSRLAYDQPPSNLLANSRLAYDQTAYYPQTGYYGQSGQDVYYSGGGQHSYEQRSSSHHDHNGRKQQREYYSQYEMADYGGNRAGYRHTKQDTAFYY